jgi:glycosyltransferase involved in cell wall biosynthesis
MVPVLVLAAGFLAAFRLRLRLPPQSGPIMALAGYTVVGLLATLVGSPDRRVGLYWGASYAAVLVIAILLHGPQPSAGRLLQIHALNMVVTGVLALFFTILAVERQGLLDMIAHARFDRIFGGRPDLVGRAFLVTANGVGRFVAIAGLLCLARLLFSRGRIRLAWALPLMVALVVLAFTVSRTAIVAFGMAALVLGWLRFGTRPILLGGAAAVALTVVSGSVPHLVSYFERGQGIVALTGVGNRLSIWESTLRVVRTSPLIGRGFHADRLLLGGDHVHDAWLHALIQAGILGLILFTQAWFLAWKGLLKAGLRTRFSGARSSERLILVEVTAILAFLTVRTLTESTGAFFGVDEFLAVPILCAAALAPVWLHPRPRAEPRRVLVSAYAFCPPDTPKYQGGEDQLGWNLVLQLTRAYDVWVLTTSRARKEIEGALAGTGARLHVCFIDLPPPLRSNRLRWGLDQLYAYLWQVRAFFFAERLARVVGFDAVHHLTYANDWMASYPQALLSRPGLRGPGGGAHRVPKAFLSRFDRRARLIQRFRAGLQPIFRLDPIFWIGQWRARAILLCNREAMQALPKRWASKAEYFPVNGVSPEDFVSRPTARDPRFTVVSAGKLVPIKGHDLVLRAFARARTRLGPATLVIIGDGPERGRLTALAEQIGIAQDIRFAGWLDRPRLLAEMAAADVFAFGSVSDGGGAVIVEAMAQALPVVALDLAGPAMHITLETGVKVPATDLRDCEQRFADAFILLHQDPDLRQRMGAAARSRAKTEYSWDHLGNRLRAIFEERVFALPAGAEAQLQALPTEGPDIR